MLNATYEKISQKSSTSQMKLKLILFILNATCEKW